MYSYFNSLDKKIINICKYEYPYFFKKNLITGVGFSYKIKNGFNTYIKCIKVFVSKKLKPLFISNKNKIHKYYKGIPTDVVENDIDMGCSLRNKVRPVTGGYSISPISGICGGTFGCLVTDGKFYYILSNNHVMASCNDLPINSPILQPSAAYGGIYPRDQIGTLSKYIPLKISTATETPENYVDCAIAKIFKRSLVSTKLTFLGRIKGVTTPYLEQPVQKVGSATELTKGKITTLGATRKVRFSEDKLCLLKDQILTTRMSDNGDSGAILLDNSINAVGLVTAGGSNSTTCNPITTVLSELKVNIVM